MKSVSDHLALLIANCVLISTGVITNVSTVNIQRGNLSRSLSQFPDITKKNDEHDDSRKSAGYIANVQGSKNDDIDLQIGRNPANSSIQLSNITDSIAKQPNVADSSQNNQMDILAENDGNDIYHRIKRNTRNEEKLPQNNSHRGFRYDTHKEFEDKPGAIMVAPRLSYKDSKIETPITTDICCWYCDGKQACTYIPCDKRLYYSGRMAPKGYGCMEIKYYENSTGEVKHYADCVWSESSRYDACEEKIRYKSYTGTYRHCKICYSDGCNYPVQVDLIPKREPPKVFNKLLLLPLLGLATCCLCMALMFICLRMKCLRKKWAIDKDRGCNCSDELSCEDDCEEEQSRCGSSRRDDGQGDAPSVVCKY
ncbi:hypothetical protein WDU94_011076 [Cyamophila willieti]